MARLVLTSSLPRLARQSARLMDVMARKDGGEAGASYRDLTGSAGAEGLAVLALLPADKRAEALDLVTMPDGAREALARLVDTLGDAADTASPAAALARAFPEVAEDGRLLDEPAGLAGGDAPDSASPQEENDATSQTADQGHLGIDIDDLQDRAEDLSAVDTLIMQGRLDEALRILEGVLSICERHGNEHDRALTLSRVADILTIRGDLDEALHIRREELLPVFERLGDVHSRAVTLGQIASILATRGDLDEALRILLVECLPIAQQMHDREGIAFVRFRCASIRLRRRPSIADEMPMIMTELDESYGILCQIGSVWGIGTVGALYGQVLGNAGRYDEALAVLTQAVDALKTMGRSDDADLIIALQRKFEVALVAKNSARP
jgi:tetratricopeptide (TPR) repeat protein